MRQRLGLIILLQVILAPAFVSAQTTQPAPDGWGQTVQAVATALLTNNPTQALNGILPDDVVLREFGGARDESRQRLIQRAEGCMLISARAYLGPAHTLASDLAADIRSCDSLPPSLKAPYLPKDDSEAKKANAVAVQWVSSMIEPAATDLVGVIMLWEPPPAETSVLLTNSTPAEPKQPVFIFIKGKQNESGEITITGICFGDAKQALK